MIGRHDGQIDVRGEGRSERVHIVRHRSASGECEECDFHAEPGDTLSLVIDILYILGMQRSGTTALERYLAAHNNTVAVGEARSVWTHRLDRSQLCSCGKPVDGCPFWTEVMDGVDEPRLHELVDYVDRPRYIPAMHHAALRSRRFRGALGPSQDIVRRFYERVVKAAPGRVVIESTKVAWYAHLLSTTEGLNVAYVHLVRDSRAVAYSQQRSARNPDGSALPTHPPSATALMWDASFILSFALDPYVRERIVHIRYEDFARDPAAASIRIESLARNSGLQALGPRGADADPNWYHSAFSNPMRFEGAFEVRNDERWRSDLPGASKAAVGALSAPLLAVHKAKIGFEKF